MTTLTLQLNDSILDYVSPEQEKELLMRMADKSPRVSVDEFLGNNWRQGFDEEDGWY